MRREKFTHSTPCCIELPLKGTFFFRKKLEHCPCHCSGTIALVLKKGDLRPMFDLCHICIGTGSGHAWLTSNGKALEVEYIQTFRESQKTSARKSEFDLMGTGPSINLSGQNSENGHSLEMMRPMVKFLTLIPWRTFLLCSSFIIQTEGGRQHVHNI